MKISLQNLGLPLLGKELTEQAAQKRTYIVRVIYASLLFFVAFLVCYETLRAGSTSPLAVLGRGRDIFMYIVYLQFAGVYLFMPAITCGVVTQEKERDSLQLLFLTRLGPWTILFEKLLGRLVPMFSFLLLSLPLLGFAYSLGGISPRLLWTGVWMLVLATVQMGTLALMCSAFFRTTVASFIASYVIAFIMFFGPYVAWMLLWLMSYLLGIDAEYLLRGVGNNISPGVMFLAMFPFFGPPYFLALTVMPGGLGFWPLFGHSVFVLGTSGVFLFLARKCIVARAFVPSRNYLLEFLKLFDRQEMQRRVLTSSGAIAVESDPARLPADEPIAWRETTKRSLGRGRYLFRILLFIEVPLVLFCGFLLVAERIHRDYSSVPRMLVTMMILMLWALAVLVVSVQSSSLIAAERSRQTLDVLCTTPLSGRDIVLQKVRGVRRLILVLLVPFFTLFLCEAWLREFGYHRQQWGEQNFNPVLYLFWSVLAVTIYLPLVAWLSLAIGLVLRTQARAMIGSMAAIVAWCAVPFIFCYLPLSIALAGTGSDALLSCTSLACPATIIFWNEIESNFLQREFGDSFWLPFVFNFAFYGVALVFFRTTCLRNANRWLGRAEGGGPAGTAEASQGDETRRQGESEDRGGACAELPQTAGP